MYTMSNLACSLLLIFACKVVAMSADQAAQHEHRRYLRDASPSWTPEPVLEEVTPRLILTDLIEAGNITAARAFAKVSGGPFPDDIPSYSGFFTVNKKYNSNLFFWFFPAETDYKNAPVLLWLQGGPGTSSLFGLFTEVGPFQLNFDSEALIPNPYSWHKNHSVIFIDNPVGTGFSFTDDDLGYATNQTQVGAELYKAMIQFFTLFPELQPLPFFITGESFAGKYIPALGHKIHINNPTAALKINLQGISVGNGFTDPYSSVGYSKFLFQLGLIDTEERIRMSDLEDTIKGYIKTGQYELAWTTGERLLSLFVSISGFNNLYNILQEDNPSFGGDYINFVQRPEIRNLLHVGDTEYSDLETVYMKMIPEIMKTVKPWLEVLMDNYRVLYYSGQLDVIIAYPLSVNMYRTLNYSASTEYLSANRTKWFVDGHLAGYTKSAGLFTEVLVRNAGHMVVTDQPVWALDLITRFTSDNMP